MSIAASNLFTRNIYMRFINTDCTANQETQNAKIVSLVVKCGALVFIIFLPLEYAIQLQLLGGIWISQTIPAVIPLASTRAGSIRARCSSAWQRAFSLGR
jgi:SSS family solute:Na+ symporter